MQQFGWLTAITVGLWLVMIGPAYVWGAVAGVEAVSFSAALCLLPGWLVIAMDARYSVSHPTGRDANRHLLIVVGGTGSRLAFVVVGGVAVHSVRLLDLTQFLVWLTVFYMATLATETYLLLRPKNTSPADRRPA